MPLPDKIIYSIGQLAKLSDIKNEADTDGKIEATEIQNDLELFLDMTNRRICRLKQRIKSLRDEEGKKNPG